MKIIVKRGAGDRPGPQIVDAILVSDRVALARGQREIDSSASKMVENGNCPLQGDIEIGSLVQLTMAGQILRGKVTATSITIDISEDGTEFNASSSITIKRLMQ